MDERIKALRAAASMLTQMRLDLDASGDLYVALYQAEMVVWNEVDKIRSCDAARFSEPESPER